MELCLGDAVCFGVELFPTERLSVRSEAEICVWMGRGIESSSIAGEGNRRIGCVRLASNSSSHSSIKTVSLVRSGSHSNASRRFSISFHAVSLVPCHSYPALEGTGLGDEPIECDDDLGDDESVKGDVALVKASTIVGSLMIVILPPDKRPGSSHNLSSSSA